MQAVLIEAQQEVDGLRAALRRSESELRGCRAALAMANQRVGVLEEIVERQQAQLALERTATHVLLVRQQAAAAIATTSGALGDGHEQR